MPYYRKIPSLVKGTPEDSIKFWEVYDQVSNHLEQVFLVIDCRSRFEFVAKQFSNVFRNG